MISYLCLLFNYLTPWPSLIPMYRIWLYICINQQLFMTSRVTANEMIWFYFSTHQTTLAFFHFVFVQWYTNIFSTHSPWSELRLTRSTNSTVAIRFKPLDKHSSYPAWIYRISRNDIALDFTIRIIVDAFLQGMFRVRCTLRRILETALFAYDLTSLFVNAILKFIFRNCLMSA